MAFTTLNRDSSSLAFDFYILSCATCSSSRKWRTRNGQLNVEMICIPTCAKKHAELYQTSRRFIFPAILSRPSFVLGSLLFHPSTRLYSNQGSLYTPCSQYTWYFKPVLLLAEQSRGDTSSFSSFDFYFKPTFNSTDMLVNSNLYCLLGDMNILNLY